MNTIGITSVHAHPQSSITERGISRREDESGSPFSRQFLSASARVSGGLNESAEVRPPASETNGAVLGARESVAAIQSNSASARGEGAQELNPFTSRNGQRQVVDVIGGTDEWRVYFVTHAPGEWVFNPQGREKFAEMYGEKALVTLDWTFTVPEHMESVWVTRHPVDITGKPLPRRSPLSET